MRARIELPSANTQAFVQDHPGRQHAPIGLLHKLKGGFPIVPFWLGLVQACLAVCLLTACGSDGTADEPPLPSQVEVSLGDTLQQNLLDLQDRGEIDVLAASLSSNDPTERFLAAQAFASLQGDDHLTALHNLLQDPNRQVQQAAAYAIGQIGESSSESHLVEAFQRQDSVGPNTPLSATLLEAVGKCGGDRLLDLLSTVSTYRPDDTHLIEGQTKAIYRFMQRGLESDLGTQRMLTVLGEDDFSRTSRLYAANYLTRAQSDLSAYYQELSDIWQNSTDPDLKMFLAFGLAKTKLPAAMTSLSEELAATDDYRVKCNIIRALGTYFYHPAKRSIHRYLYDPNIHVASTAVQAIIDHGSQRYWKEYLNLSLGNYPWQVKVGLLHATNKYIPAGNQMFQKINEDLLRQRINGSKNLYERAAAVRALAQNPARFRYAVNLYRNSSEPVLRTAAVDALVGVTAANDFPSMQSNSRKEILALLLEALQSGDGGEAATAAKFLDTDNLNFATYNIDPTHVLQTAMDRLELPRDISAWRSLRDVLERYGPTPTMDLPRGHAIDWPNLDGIADSTRVVVHTSAGKFTLRLIPLAAPGTVANFVELIRLRYYDGKVFHRVVPNFVIQGGGSRGDGYGRLDYTIRSELNQSYYDQAGYVGMASAGKDTESVQWFVTHCPTPHLDGRYSLFAKVTDGMSTVHSIEQGARIDSLTIH